MNAQPAQGDPASRSADGLHAGHEGFLAFSATEPGYIATSRSPFLSTLTPGRSQWRAAIVVSLLSLALFAGVAPFAKVPLPQLGAFLPIYQSALVVVDVITMLLLVGQYLILRSTALLVLA